MNMHTLVRAERYTLQERAMWSALYAQQMAVLRSCAAPELLQGRELLGIWQDSLPEYAHINARLEPLTGWRVVEVDGMVGDEDMVRFLASKRFPASWKVREQKYKNYSPEPDIFHDIFGHVPMLANPTFAHYLHAFGKKGLEALAKGQLERIMRLYFYTVEFGLIQTPAGLKIYGSALASSKEEATNAFKPEARRVAFDLQRVITTPVHNGSFQNQYFVIESYRQLKEAINSPALLL